MTQWNKIALAAAGCGVVLYVYGQKLFRMKANLIVTPLVSVYSVGLTGLVLRTDVQLKNPSDTGFSLQYPFVTLLYGDTLLGSSQVVNQTISIKPYSEANIQKILIDIPISGVLSALSGLLAAIQEKQPVNITVKVTTVVDLGWKKWDYTDTQVIALNH